MWVVLEKNNHNAVHALCDTRDRALDWIEKYGDSKIFDDKTLKKSSFIVKYKDK